MSATTAPAVKTRLVELFKSVVDGETQVWLGRPVVEHQINENVYVEGVNIDREWATLGRPQPHQREENYRVDVTVEVYDSSMESEQVEARLWQIVEQLDDAISSDVALGGQENVQWALVERINQDAKAGGDGWLYRAVMEVAVKARI